MWSILMVSACPYAGDDYLDAGTPTPCAASYPSKKEDSAMAANTSPASPANPCLCLHTGSNDRRYFQLTASHPCSITRHLRHLKSA